MSTIRDSVAELYTPIYDQFLLEGMKEGEYSGVMEKVFDVREDSTKEVKHDDLSGLGMWEEADEGSGGNYEDPVLGYPKTFTHTKFIKKFQGSFESVDDDEYFLLKKEGQAKEMGRGCRARVEKDTGNYLYKGFGTAVTGPDGQYIWDTDHDKNREETGVNYDNLLSGAFSHDNLELAETQITTNMYTMSAIPIPISGKPLLVYPPALRGAVARVLSDRAIERPDTTERDSNRFAKGKAWSWEYEPVEWIWVNAANGGSNTAWYIIFPWMKHLVFYWRQRPHFTSWVDEENEYYSFKGRMRNSLGADNWRCGFASTGL